MTDPAIDVASEAMRGHVLADIGQRFYNQPILVGESVAQYLSANAGQRMQRPVMDASKLFIPGLLGQSATHKPYVVQDGVAIIFIKGTLEHDSYYYGSYWTGYDAIRVRFDMAQEDPDVKGIAFMVNSGGGMVAGNFDLVDHIYAARGNKPMIAIVDEHAYSGAYSIASAADKIVVARTGGVGSIGALVVHYDYSQALNGMGVVATIIRGGERKAKPNMLEPLDDATQAAMQTSIDAMRTLFIDTVVRNRAMNSDAVRGTEADTFSAADAIALGLADAVGAPDQALAAFKRELSGSNLTGMNVMTENTNPAAAIQGQAEQVIFTQTQMNAAMAQATADATAAQATTQSETANTAATAERERIFAIVSCDEAKGREAAALAMAKNPAMTVDSAKETLGALPTMGMAAGGDALSMAMEMTGGGAEVGHGEGSLAEGETLAIIDTGGIYARMNAGPSSAH